MFSSKTSSKWSFSLIVLALFASAIVAVLTFSQPAIASPKTPTTLWLDSYAITMPDQLTAGNVITISGGQFAVGVAIYSGTTQTVTAEISYNPGAPYPGGNYHYNQCVVGGNFTTYELQGLTSGYLGAKINVRKYMDGGYTIYYCIFDALKYSENNFTLRVKTDGSPMWEYADPVKVIIAPSSSITPRAFLSSIFSE